MAALRPAERRLRCVLGGLLTVVATTQQQPPCSAVGTGTASRVCSAGPQRFSLGLEGKIVVITGASKGIGAAVARQFAAEGAHLHLVSRTESDLQKLKAELKLTHPTTRCEVHAMDLSAPGSVAKLWSDLDSKQKTVDILVNNAGAIPAGDLLAVDEETWRASWDLKVFGYINMSREAYRRMKQSPNEIARSNAASVIINVIGAGGVRPTFGYIAGATANAGLIAFTEALGAEAAADGIRVLGVNPGSTLTSRLTTLIEQGIDNAQEITDGPFRAAMPEEIADTVVYLASDRARHISGTVLTVDKGATKRA